MDAQGPKLLEKVIIDGKLSFKEAKADENGTIKVGKVTYSISGTTVTFIVDNVSGASLPNSGGPGTGLIYFMGALIAALAGVGFVMKKIRKM